MSIENKKTRIVCIGDSITEGFGLGDDPKAYYPSALNEFLGNKFEVYNKGVTSSCVIDHEEDGHVFGLPYKRQPRYKEALELAGDIYIIMLGTNDASDGYDEKSGKKDPYANMIKQKALFAPNYQSIIDAVKQSNSRAEIFLVTPIPIQECIWPKHQEMYLAKLLPIIKKLATENKCEFIDLHKEFERFPEELFSTLYLKDGLHPNITGANVIASIIASYLRKKLRQ